MDITLKVVDPTDAVRDAILAGLLQFNTANGFPPDPRSIALTLTDSLGAVIGGLWAKTVYDWLFVEYLVVPDVLRGQGHGARLMAEAEAMARQRGCVGAWLTTFPFQAQPFYEKLGYTVFGRLEQSPRNNVRIFMRKDLS